MIDITNSLIEEPKYNNIIVVENKSNVGINFYPQIAYQLTPAIKVEVSYSLDVRKSFYRNEETGKVVGVIYYDVNDIYEQQTYVNDVRVTSTTAFEKSFVDAGFAELGKIFTGSIPKEEETKALRKTIQENKILKKVFGKIIFSDDVPEFETYKLIQKYE